MTNKIQAITVDPGLGGTGWAAWAAEGWRDPVSPVDTGVIVFGGKSTWLERANMYADSFDQLLFSRKPETVWVEFPGLHTTASGMASAIRGDIFKLMFLVGMFADVCRIRCIKFVELPVNEWKGTMSKEAASERVYRRIGSRRILYPNHTMDAVGMGLYVKGVWNDTGAARPTRSNKDT